MDGPILDVRLLDDPVDYHPLDPIPPSSGGESVFLGRTRREEHPEHGALRVLRDLAADATERFGCHAVRVHHAVGEVPVGAASVLVQVVCGHRAESFAACRFLIDELKRLAPIWKREEWDDGFTWVEGSTVRPHESGGAADDGGLAP